MEILHENSQCAVKHQKVFFRDAGVDLVLYVQGCLANFCGYFKAGFCEGEFLSVAPLAGGTVHRDVSQVYQFLNFPGDGYNVPYAESIYVGYRYYQKKKMDVLFPFGFGLSYTSFLYDNLKLSKKNMLDTDVLSVSVDITNTGEVSGKEIVQLYVSDHGDQSGRPQRPVRELKGFEKVSLEPGETKTVTFELDKRSFAYYEERISDWIVPSAEYYIEIGASCEDIRLSESVNVEATKTVPLKIRPDTVFGELLRDPRTQKYTMDNLINQQSSGISSFPPEAIAALMDHNPIRGLRNFGNESAERVEEIMYELKTLVHDTE